MKIRIDYNLRWIGFWYIAEEVSAMNNITGRYDVRDKQLDMVEVIPLNWCLLCATNE